MGAAKGTAEGISGRSPGGSGRIVPAHEREGAGGVTRGVPADLQWACNAPDSESRRGGRNLHNPSRTLGGRAGWGQRRRNSKPRNLTFLSMCPAGA